MTIVCKKSDATFEGHNKILHYRFYINMSKVKLPQSKVYFGFYIDRKVSSRS